VASISKRLRFEVLKRDNFQCAYCGARAPDVALEVDHILARANGGTDEFLNLVTACWPCNRGKSSVPLDENHALERQVSEIERIEEQAATLDQLRQRKAEADELLDLQVDAIDDAIHGHTECSLTESGRKTVRRWLSTDSVEALMTAVDAAAETYARGRMSKREWETFFKKIPAIAAFRKRHGAKSEAFRKALYAAGIMRNRHNQGAFPEYTEGGFQDLYEEMFDLLPAAACEEIADEIIKAAKTYPQYLMLEEELVSALCEFREAFGG